MGAKKCVLSPFVSPCVIVCVRVSVCWRQRVGACVGGTSRSPARMLRAAISHSFCAGPSMTPSISQSFLKSLA